MGVPIAWVLADTLPTSKGKTILAKTKGLSALDQFLSGNFLVVIVNEQAWVRLNHAQRLALLDHELCHVMGDTDTGFTMRDHDIEEFNAVIERHGAWSRDVVEFLATARKAQIELPMDLPPVEKAYAGDGEYKESKGDFQVTFTQDDSEALRDGAESLRVPKRNVGGVPRKSFRARGTSF